MSDFRWTRSTYLWTEAYCAVGPRMACSSVITSHRTQHSLNYAFFLFFPSFSYFYPSFLASHPWVPGAISSGIKRPRREAGHSPPSGTEVKNLSNYTATPHPFSWLGGIGITLSFPPLRQIAGKFPCGRKWSWRLLADDSYEDALRRHVFSKLEYAFGLKSAAFLQCNTQ
jgi:hypothetical protein